MGYESRIYVVDKGDFTIEVNGKERKYASLVASFELCKVYDVSDKMRKYPATDCYFYEGDEAITEDKYAATLKEVPIADAIAIIEEAAMGIDYRRFEPCLALLKGFNTDEWGDLVVLHYGH